MDRKINDDYCTDILLKLVAKGSSIITEILRMKDFIPEVYTSAEEQIKFKNIIFDFSYFNKIDQYEEKIKNNASLRNLDEEFRENYSELLDRFYCIFNNIFKYFLELKNFVSQLKKGLYVLHTLESLLLNRDSRYIVCESLYLYGVMLILVDRLIPSTLREKIIVSHYRVSGQSTIENIKEVITLFQTTNYLPNSDEKLKNYPIEYFKRCQLDKEFINMIISIIKDNDIYDHIAAFPNPNHRSHALSTQASMLFICLFFNQDFLENENSKMREIVDKHFSDNWVISIYLGYTCDLMEWWNDFKASKNALKITINETTVKTLSKMNMEKLNVQLKKVQNFYMEGTINENYVLDNISDLLNIIRESNVILKWFILHMSSKNKNMKLIIEQNYNEEKLINLLLGVAHFENNIKNMFQKLIDEKENMWESDKENSLFRLKELSEYFAGMKNFGKQVKQDDFKEFFEKNYQTLFSLKISNSKIAGRRIIIIKDGLENIKKYHYVEGNLQIKQYINEIIEYLNHMIRVANIKQKILVTIAHVSDFSYGWINIQNFIPLMQTMLKRNSKNILYLKSVFLKMASIMNMPLIRLFETNSHDIDSVTNYFSGELVNFVRKVLQIVPSSVFLILQDIINIFNKGFKEPPVKFLKADIKDYAQLEERYVLASACQKISLFTKGILAMEKTFVGIIEVDPKEILEDGIRKELLNLLSVCLHKEMNLDINDSKIELYSVLKKLEVKVECIKKAFLYIQDYINIDGYKIWNEELHRLINCYTDIEANKFLSKKINLEKKYNLSKYPIHTHLMPKDEKSVTFLGRLLKYIIHITQPKQSTFSINLLSWTSQTKKDKTVFSLKILKILRECIGIEGFQGFFRLISYNCHNQINKIKEIYNEIFIEPSIKKSFLLIRKNLLFPLNINLSQADESKNIFLTINEIGKQGNPSFISSIIYLGHLEKLKSVIQHCLKENTSYESSIFYSQMNNLNNLLLLIEKNNEEIEFPKEDISNNINKTVDITNKDNNVYDSFNFYSFVNNIMYDFSFSNDNYYGDISRLDNIIILMSILTYYEIQNNYCRSKGLLLRKGKNSEFDFYYMILGIKVILYQLGRKNLILYFSTLTYLMKISYMKLYSINGFKGYQEEKYVVPENIYLFGVFIKEIQYILELSEAEMENASGLLLY